MLVYVNRLSDYFFVLARYCNHLCGIEDEIWRG
jgi:cob(I)alamin adenosyltransferase